MRISRIYYSGELHQGERIELSPESSHYIMHVLRLQVAASLILFNGDGNEYQAILTDLKKKTVSVTIQQTISVIRESSLQLHLAQAITRNEKMDWVIQKAVELGVVKITPLMTRYCTVKLAADRMAKRLQHWQNIIISACEQSGRNVLPRLAPIIDFSEWIKTEDSGLKLFCDPNSKTSIVTLPKANSVVIVIGPEGGLSTQEIKTAQEQDFTGVSLGPRILRTETAGLAAITLLQGSFGDMR